MLLLDTLPFLENMSRLEIAILHSEVPNVDAFAAALDKNTSLTEIAVYGRNDAPNWEFVCSLFSQRNRIQKLLRHQETVPRAIWPLVLRKCAPNHSSMFMAMQNIPWKDMLP